MSETIACPKCYHDVTVGEDDYGQMIVCKNCGQHLEIEKTEVPEIGDISSKYNEKIVGLMLHVVRECGKQTVIMADLRRILTSFFLVFLLTLVATVFLVMMYF